jgi:hypothetical protein
MTKNDEELENKELSELSAEQTEVLTKLSNEASSKMEKLWGSGFPEFKKGEQKTLLYHNENHAEMNARGSAKMAEALGLPPAYIALAEYAGRSHDLVQGKGRGIDEKETAAEAGQKLRETGLFSEEIITMVELSITGTEPIFDDKFNIIGQKASQQEYPSETAELFAKAVACGDFAHLYSPSGPYLSLLLYQEIKGIEDPSVQPPIDEDLINFVESNVTLGENFTFPLPEAEEILGAHRDHVIEMHKETVAQLRDGTISSWDQLTARALEFMEVEGSVAA